MARYRVRASKGIVEARPDVSFEIIVAILAAKPVVHPNGFNIAHSSRSQVGFQQLPYHKPLVESILGVSEDCLLDAIGKQPVVPPER